MVLLEDFIHIFKKELTLILYNLFWKKTGGQGEGTLPKSYEISITLMPKPDKDRTKQKRKKEL